MISEDREYLVCATILIYFANIGENVFLIVLTIFFVSLIIIKLNFKVSIQIYFEFNQF